MNTSKVYITALHLKHGGVEMVIASLANAFVEQGIDVEIISTYNFGEPAYKIDDKVKITYLTNVLPNREAFSVAIKNKNPIGILKEGFKAAKVLLLKNSTMKKAIRNISDGIVISTRHDHSIMLSKYGRKNVLKIAQLHFDHKFDKNLIEDFKTKYGNIDYFTLLTDKVTGEIKQAMEGFNSHTKCVTVPNFLNFEPVDLSIKRNKQVIAAGRLHPDKDFHAMLRIWKKVCSVRNDHILKIAGEGELDAKLKAYAEELGISNKVCFMGAVPHGKLLQEMHESVCYLLTSVSEALPMVLLESMYCGTPPVAFDLRIGTGSIITDEVNGYIIPDRNEELFADKIIELINKSDEEIAVLSDNCRARAKDFSKEKIVDLWLNLFNGHI